MLRIWLPGGSEKISRQSNADCKPDEPLQNQHANKVLTHSRCIEQQQDEKELERDAERAGAEIELIGAAGGDIYPVLAAEEPHDEYEREFKRATTVGEQFVPLVGGKQAAPGGHIGDIILAFDWSQRFLPVNEKNVHVD
jgi:hypothetical protein